MNYFDLHCDTLTELYDRGETLENSTCHVSGDSISRFDTFAQVTAVFSKVKLSDEECFNRFFNVCDNFLLKNEVEFIIDFKKLSSNLKERKPSFILSVEDARLLSDDMGKFHAIVDRGVKLITPLWGGKTCIGGAFDTDEGLTPFGKRLIENMLLMKIIPDISHASRKSASYILDACKEASFPAVASHSNSYSVYPHPRNLTDSEAETIAQLGGIIGISFAPQHLTKAKTATAYHIMEHINRYANIVGGKHIALGCDYDGIESTPMGFEDQSKIPTLKKVMTENGFTNELIKDLFWNNAFDFFANL